MKTKNLDLNNPVDAKYFLTKVMPKIIPGFTKVDYADGSTRSISDMNENQLIDAALFCAPIFQAAHPDQIEINHEQ